jgi:hypothetical protein
MFSGRLLFTPRRLSFEGEQQKTSNICANRFYDHLEEQKTAVSEYLDKTFGRWYDDIRDDT